MTNQTATADTDPQVHPTTLLPQEYAATRDRIAKINARAIKRGFTGRLEVTGTRRIITNKGQFPDLPAGARVTLIDTTITGEAPCYAGWRFLASLDVLPAGESVTWIVRSAAGTEANVDRSTLIVGYCGHCTTNRPNRRKSYLVENVETGERIQVGSACIKDFLGHEGKPVFLSTEDIEAGRGRGSYTPQSFETTYALALAFAVAEVGGGFKAASSFGVSTRDLMASYLWGNSTVDRKLRAEVDAVLAAHTAAAESIRTAVREHFEDEASNGKCTSFSKEVTDEDDYEPALRERAAGAGDAGGGLPGIHSDEAGHAGRGYAADLPVSAAVEVSQGQGGRDRASAP